VIGSKGGEGMTSGTWSERVIKWILVDKEEDDINCLRFDPNLKPYFL